ncbi:helix-turn-helix domain-containing protein [Paenibacillus sp. WQ 127069]|uniref:Helix-turn-helix domain-containing protein n=1 Tax=Paenibacillus baimaensis TaxID=2982185 RepID=A0ABT2U9U4_9BACL|nr:helix-turn-helix domain-containing protein [Paenibacillus sp. WQ 127069]MCU6791365.1 helix-turn-helix domain-containing protein [Paenibacillus sp. WQ 127069]
MTEIGMKAAQQGDPISFGVGRQVGKLLEISLTYREAMESLEYGYRCKKERFVQFYNGREPIDLFRAVNEKELLAYYLQTMHPFKELGENEQLDLLQTLQTYYEMHCHLGGTAKRLFVHRNTVIYRLNKCTQLIGRNLNSADESLRFRIAFIIKPLLQL